MTTTFERATDFESVDDEIRPRTYYSILERLIELEVATALEVNQREVPCLRNRLSRPSVLFISPTILLLPEDAVRQSRSVFGATSGQIQILPLASFDLEI